MSCSTSVNTALAGLDICVPGLSKNLNSLTNAIFNANVACLCSTELEALFTDAIINCYSNPTKLSDLLTFYNLFSECPNASTNCNTDGQTLISYLDVFETVIAATLLDCKPSSNEYVVANGVGSALGVCFGGSTTGGSTGGTGGTGGSTGNSGNGGSSSSSSSSSSNIPMIAGIAGGVGVLLIAGIVAFFVMRKKSANKNGGSGAGSASGFSSAAAAAEQAKMEQAKLNSIQFGDQQQQQMPGYNNQYDQKPPQQFTTAPPVQTYQQASPYPTPQPFLAASSQPQPQPVLYPGGPVASNAQPQGYANVYGGPAAPFVPPSQQAAWNQGEVKSGNLFTGAVGAGGAAASASVPPTGYASAYDEKMQLKEQLGKQSDQYQYQQPSQQSSSGFVGQRPINSADWSVQDVTQWLLEHGFERDIVDRFSQNEINGLILQQLTIDTLKLDLGIESLRTRTNIMIRIDQLKNMNNQQGQGSDQSVLPPAYNGPY
ncbi:WD repeat, SAM and U-box domain-containing protein 1 [Blyttiomyces sp. JEL0837]|nr:WD repeat, SAM and U-box domain-containing protein 1 [Blyttiomyces sp. JEL0837]